MRTAEIGITSHRAAGPFAESVRAKMAMAISLAALSIESSI
jgi:hypothetical protein